MIIVTENKKQHYIIKKFLTEISKVNLNESNQEENIDNERHRDVGFYPIINRDEDLDVTDKEVITQNQPVTMQQLQKAAKVKPKMINLAKLVKSGIAVSILAAASYFTSDLNNNKVAQDIAKDNNISVQKVIQASPQINNNAEIPQTFPLPKPQIQDDTDQTSQNVDDEMNDNASAQQIQKSMLIEKSKERIKTFEGFKPYPYKDKTGVSIGYGTFFIDNVKPDSLPENWRDSLYEKCGLSKKEASQYEVKSQDELIKQFDEHIENKKSKIDTILSSVENKINLKNSELKKWQKIRDKAKRKRYTDTVQSEIDRLEKRKNNLNDQKDNLDKEKETAKSRGLISKELAEECLTRRIKMSIDLQMSDSSVFGKNFLKINDNVQIVIVDMSYNIGDYFLETKYPKFKEYSEEYSAAFKEKNASEQSSALKNMWEEIKDRSPDYHAQQSKNKRAEKNTNLLKDAYEESTKKVNESKYSLKSAYSLLYN